MRKLVALLVLAAAAWWLLSERRYSVVERVVVGYEDGTATLLEPGSPERELLVGTAAEALRA